MTIGSILLFLIFVSWFVDYQKWLDELVSSIPMIALGLIMLYKDWLIRNNDRILI